MKLTQKAISMLNREARLSLALELDFSELWINKLVEANKENGPLTTVAAVNKLKEITGLSDSEILEPVEAESKANTAA